MLTPNAFAPLLLHALVCCACPQVRQDGTGLSDDHKDKIMDTVIALNIFLDVPKPFTWIVHVSHALCVRGGGCCGVALAGRAER